MPETDWPPHQRERRPWRQTVPKGPRADRDLREVEVSLPPMVAALDYPLERPLRLMMDNALNNLGRLDNSHGSRLGALDSLLLRTESVASSKIENIESSLSDYARALFGVRANASARSMVSATEALVGIIEDAESTGRIRLDALLQAHRSLFSRSAEDAPKGGQLRRRQSWIGGSDYSPRGALFVPPPPETVDDYLADLVAYANRDDVPVLVQAAVVHAQFESIHPFHDGNGRVGRTLVHAVLLRRKATRHLTVPIASGLVANRQRYFDALGDYRDGRAYTLIGLLTSSTLVASHESRRTATHLHEIRQGWASAVGPVRGGTALARLLELLPREPIVTAAVVAERLDVTLATAQQALRRLHEVGIVAPTSRRPRDQVWAATDVLDELSDLNLRIESVSRSKDAPAP